MSGSIEKVSQDGSDPQLVKPSANSYDLGERRRAALADVDNAKFSYVPQKYHRDQQMPISILVGSTPRSAQLLVLVFSPMREYISTPGECTLTRNRYDIFAINIASTMLGYVYGKGDY